jgi:hypothetical protein
LRALSTLAKIFLNLAVEPSHWLNTFISDGANLVLRPSLGAKDVRKRDGEALA